MSKKTELRAAAARLLYNSNRSTSDYDMLIDFIDSYFDSLPDVSDIRVGKWIPCSVATPNYFIDVLVTIDEGDVLCLHREYNNKWYDNDCYILEPSKVIAWMPLPEPYKGEQNDR